ncbi:C-GCAxxG-C-C family protein [uncultured Ruminococcus sp.]|uniref:C-GCAxxG-C-C family protein n=1 Tax=uncultured Ruminococcus sp. TaxID=165186 RepID=UPI0025F57290|nr:C-GCAxxG-C-C family protein [uncultured Ruminococcus sp.]
MPKKSENAIEYHKNGYSCSGAVLSAFAEDAGMTADEAMSAARPYAGGRMVKCGAVLAACHVLKARYGEKEGAEKAAELERRFTEMNSTINCRELKGAGTGKVLRSCRGCVTDAAQILEELLEG